MNGQSIKLLMTAVGALCSAGCLKLDLGGGMLACSSNGKCPVPYRCHNEICVADLDGSAAPPSDGGQIIGTPLATFDTDREGFGINDWDDPTVVNLGSLSPDPVMIGWDGVEGNPMAGSLRVTIPFTDYNQEVEISRGFWSMPRNWTGQTLHVRVKLLSGDPEGTPMGVALILLSAIEDRDAGTTYHSAYQSFTAEETADWQEFTIGSDGGSSPYDPMFDPMNVGELSVFISTSNPLPRPATKPTTAVVFIDSLSLSNDQ